MAAIRNNSWGSRQDNMIFGINLRANIAKLVKIAKKTAILAITLPAIAVNQTKILNSTTSIQQAMAYTLTLPYISLFFIAMASGVAYATSKRAGISLLAGFFTSIILYSMSKTIIAAGTSITLGVLTFIFIVLEIIRNRH